MKLCEKQGLSVRSSIDTIEGNIDNPRLGIHFEACLARSSIRLGHGPLKAERRVRFPYALPLIFQWVSAKVRKVDAAKLCCIQPPLDSNHAFSALAGRVLLELRDASG